MNAVHLLKTYCLPTLTYGLENALLTENTLHKIHVVWNNCFRHIFRCCWRESVRPLQYFCKSLPLSYLVDQTKLLFWKKMYISNNVILYSLSRFVLNRFMSVASQYRPNVVSPAQPVDDQISCLVVICQDTQLLVLLLCVLLFYCILSLDFQFA